MSGLWPLGDSLLHTDAAVVVDSSTPLRLLLVEDSPSDAALILDLLEDELPHGHLDTAPTLAAAELHLTEHDYDLVLADLTLPDADGERVVMALRAAAPRIPLVVLTGRVDRQLALWSLAAGAQDYLVKGDHDGPRLADAILRGLQRSLAEQQTHDRLTTALELQREAAAKLRALDEARSDFVATANHELRTPLTCIAAYAELLQDTPGLSDLQAEFVDTICRNAARLSALTDDLLLLSSFSAGEPVTRVETDMRSVVTAGITGLSMLAADKGVTVRCLLPEEGLLVRGDARHLERVVLNLVTNAVKFTPGHGTVTCSLAAGSDGDVLLAVADTGIGIPPEELDHVFDKFFRGAWAHERAIQGTGLGLHITAGIVEQHGGHISVESSPGGTTITVTLPGVERQDDPVVARLLTVLPDTLLHPRELATLLAAAHDSSRETGQWELLADALQLARARLGAEGCGGEHLERVVGVLAGARHEPGPFVSAYLEQLQRGDQPGAISVARHCLAAGMSALDILVDVLEPAQHVVGRLWERASLSIEEEGFCTRVTEQLLSELFADAPPQSALRPVGRVVAVDAPGSQHVLGLRFVTTVLESAGWVTVHAAPDSDQGDLVAMLTECGADLLLVSASMAEQVEAVRALVRAVRDDPCTRDVRIVVGGRAFSLAPDLVDVVGADAWARDARAALATCHRLVAPSQTRTSLPRGTDIGTPAQRRA